MKNAEFSAVVCIACFQILWWNAERTFLTLFTIESKHCFKLYPTKQNKTKQKKKKKKIKNK